MKKSILIIIFILLIFRCRRARRQGDINRNGYPDEWEHWLQNIDLLRLIKHYENILSLIFIFVIGEIGTKTPVLSLLITFLVSFIYFMIRSLKKKNYKIFTGLLIILTSVTVTSFLVVPKTNFYKNIMIHVKYLKLDSVDDIFENDYVFDHFIFSQRITFLKNTSNRYNKASLKNKLFGTKNKAINLKF